MIEFEIVFYSKADGHAGNVLKLLRSKLCKETNESAEVILRRNYAMSEATGTDDNTGYVNLSQIGGNITFDFGNNTLTLGSQPLFNMECKWGWDGSKNCIYPSNITVLGGKIVASGTHVVNYSSAATNTSTVNNYNKEKLVYITFNETDFVLGTKTFINTSDSANLELGATMELTLNGCDIDVTGNTASKFIVFDGVDSTNKNKLHLTINGKGGHAALRDNIVDPILPTAKLIDALYEIPALSPDQSVPTILSIGRIEANGATNIVPDQVRLQGTMRTFDEQWREQVKKLVNYHCDNIEKKYGVAIERNFGSGYPAVFNSPRLADVAFKVVADAFGPAAIATLGVRPTGEDFGYYTERYPSLFYRLGVGYSGEEFEAGKAGSLHTPQLLPDTKAIGIGVSIMTLLALHFAKI